ncbi:efflux RND transporter periplasmic adaptor subunit [Aquibaculum arenosum]|uniref:Efflux RND transporter periplasmic adaptor subunit n=1 Tax=Aquibaculum arenosum TaxID=3032591 RepID=A0ABT5YJV1_9PROT|nr:efflux RND transporter periplasmic adaptor subunit [Fodinicurvata sp. CAU 1616]MDF2095197.1 efflux RND transporter periplasmic adaptor subunit [Fodinicurvata sp. CAU 1616]
MRKALYIASAVVLLLLAGLGGSMAWSALTPAGEDAVMTTPVTKGTLRDEVSALGTLEPQDFVDVGVQVSGQIQALHVELGQEVVEGDLLAELDADVFQARVDSDAAELRRLEASLAEREAQLELARRQFERSEKLLAQRATSREAYESAEAAVKVAEAQIMGLRAQISQSESALRANEANLGYTRVYAPMSGTVVSLDAKVGQTLNANQSTPIILRIADLATMTVRAQVSEADVMRLEPGMRAYFTTLGDRNRRWEGSLRQILPTPEVVNDVVLYQALFEVPNADGRLLTQMTAQVFFVRDAAEDALQVPLSAVESLGPNAQGEEQGQVLVQSNGRLEPRQVVLGLRNRVAVEVRDGLREGEQIALQLPASGAAPGGASRQRVPRL